MITSKLFSINVEWLVLLYFGCCIYFFRVSAWGPHFMEVLIRLALEMLEEINNNGGDTEAYLAN
jgi:hypothetical protein